jgi:hypothetical protein
MGYQYVQYALCIVCVDIGILMYAYWFMILFVEYNSYVLVVVCIVDALCGWMREWRRLRGLHPLTITTSIHPLCVIHPPIHPPLSKTTCPTHLSIHPSILVYIHIYTCNTSAWSFRCLAGDTHRLKLRFFFFCNSSSIGAAWYCFLLIST